MGFALQLQIAVVTKSSRDSHPVFYIEANSPKCKLAIRGELENEFRYLLLNSIVDNPNSQIIPSPMKITLLSLIVVICVLNSNSLYIFQIICLFLNSAGGPVCFSANHSEFVPDC